MRIPIAMTFIACIALLALLNPLVSAGTFKTITIDDSYGDWVGVPVLDSDAADNAGSVDIFETQIANDNNNLYIRNTYHGALSLSTFIAMDVDQDPNTGFDVFSLGLIGSEVGWQNDFPFEQFDGVFNVGGLSGDYFGIGAALLAPFADASSREVAISLSTLFGGGVYGSGTIFPDDSFDILIYTDVGAGDVSSVISYTLAVPEPASWLLVTFGCGLLTSQRRRRLS